MEILIYKKSAPLLEEVQSTLEKHNLIDIESGVFSISGKSCHFSNPIDFCKKIEMAENIRSICVAGFILDFSSEINIRTMISSFFGLVHEKLVICDTRERFKSRLALLGRVFRALNLNPTYKTERDLIFLEFEKKTTPKWNDFQDSIIEEVICTNMIDAPRFINVLTDSIKNKKPFSYIRINHCENRILGFGHTFSQEEAEITYKIQFGAPLKRADTFNISNMLKTALANASCVGIPHKNHPSSNKLHTLENSTYVHLKDFECFQEKIFTNVNLHYELGKLESFKHLLQLPKKLIAITCRDISNIEKTIGRKITTIPIPAEYNFSNNQAQENHYPAIYNNILQYIKNWVRPGDLVIIGAGILGKIYCNAVKEQGAVSIDLGSLFDAMAGVNSRGAGFGNDFWWNSSREIQ